MSPKHHPPFDSEQASQFRAEEYGILRGEVEDRSKEQREMERNVVVITTAVISFLLVNPAQKPELAGLATIGWLIPPIVAFLALGRWLESLKMIRTLADYIYRYELSTVGNEGAWEKRLRDERSEQNLKFISGSSIFFWLTITGGPSALFARHLSQTFFQDGKSAMIPICAFIVTATAAFGLMLKSGLLCKDKPLDEEGVVPKRTP